MEAEQQLTLDLGGNRFRITTSDPDTATRLGEILAHHTIDDDALLGFRLTLPGGPAQRCSSAGGGAGLAVLVDCTGVVLARSREPEAVLAALGGHLTALHHGTPAPPVARLRVRALLADDHAILVAPPLLSRPPVVERRLSQLGYRVADVPFVDVDVESSLLQPADVPWPELAELDRGPGHAGPHELDRTVVGLLWPSADDLGAPTPARITHALAAAALTGSRSRRMTDAERLADRLTVTPVDPADDAAPYEILRDLRR